MNALAYDALAWGPRDADRTVVLLHYFGGTAASWQPVAALLAARGVRCVALDQPGFGAAPPLERYDVMAQAEAVRARIADLDVGDYVLAGHSMGGKIAMAIATLGGAAMPGALVLVAPSPATYESMEAEERARMLAEYPSRENAATSVEGAVCAPLPPSLHALALETHGAAHPRAWRWWIEEGTRDSIWDAAKTLALPVHVVASEDDPVISLGSIEDDVLGLISHAKLTALSETGHLIPLEAPEVVAEVIAATCAAL